MGFAILFSFTLIRYKLIDINVFFKRHVSGH